MLRPLLIWIKTPYFLLLWPLLPRTNESRGVSSTCAEEGILEITVTNTIRYHDIHCMKS